VLTATVSHDDPSEGENVETHAQLKAIDLFPSDDPLKRGLEDAPVVTKLGSPISLSGETKNWLDNQSRKEVVLRN
jgi:hypothetical protein